ncbi:MAG: efflux RND transporter permease subunit [Rhizobiales bacterium]|nr:efflux RND transporter permease subunit [Hyphomicrobiales bacterium]
MNSILETILNRPKTVLTMMVVMILAGISTYISIPKEADPDIDVPVFSATIILQGISPEDSERLLVKPMETELRSLEGLKELTAIAGQGYATLIGEFQIDMDLAKAGVNFREKVDKAKAELPSDAEEPIVDEFNFSLFPTIIVTLSGDVPERTLFNMAKKLQNELEAIPTVLEAKLSGHREELLEVLIDPTKLEGYEIDPRVLGQRLTSNNQLITAGSLDRGAGRFNVKVPGLIRKKEDVFNIPLKTGEDGDVTLSDVATIRRTFKDATSFSRYNGKPALALSVVKRKGTNIIENNKKVREVVAKFTKDWPETVKIDFALDQSKFIFEVIGSLQSSIITAILLVMIVVVATLGLRSGLLVGLSIPASFMTGFLLIGVMGLTVNMMLMFGMVLTVGILVDGAIVVVEYADRKMAEGLSRKDAYILAAKRMFWPVTSSTATTLAAFLPLLLWPGVSGKFMSYLPLTVIFVLTASLITAMIFLPALGSLFGKNVSDPSQTELAQKLSGNQQMDYKEIPGFSGLYVRFAQRLIHHPFKVLLISFMLMYGVIAVFGQVSKGVEFFVDTEPEQALVFISARGNISAQEELELVREVEDIALNVGGIASVFTNSGGRSGGPELGTGATDAPLDQIGQLTIELAEFATRRPGKVILEELREKTKDLAGIKVEVRKREDGPPTGKAIKLEVYGQSRPQVYDVIAKIDNYMKTSMKDLRNIEDTRPLPGIEWVLDVDRKEAGRFGADVASVGGLIQLVTNGFLIAQYRPDNAEDEVDIRARFPRTDRTLDGMDGLRLRTSNGLVPIENFVKRSPAPKVNTIIRKDGNFVTTIKAAVKTGVNENQKVQELDKWIKSQTWPQGVRFRFRGADEEQKEAGEFLGKAMVGALFIMFIILLTQFNSFYQTFLTLSTVVLSVIGVLLGMIVTGQTFSIIMTGTGVVALAGIVVNNSIVLIDTYNRLMELGMSPIDASLRAAAQRLRPVLLTTITTICGLLPMALQINLDFFDHSVQFGSITSIWWVQLSTAIIFGLGFATIITLVLTPVMLAFPTIFRTEIWPKIRNLLPKFPRFARR